MSIFLFRISRGLQKPWFPRRFLSIFNCGMHDTSTVILVGFRHGNRNPAHFLNPNSKLTWGSEGELALNEFGRAQAQSLGDCISQYILNFDKINSINCYSSSAERCMETMKIVKSKLGAFNESITVDDEMLKMFAVDHPRNVEVWSSVSSECSNDLLPEIQDALSTKKVFIEHLRKNTGWKMTISDLSDLADNVEQMEKFHEKLPVWLEKPDLRGYDKYRMLLEVTAFSEYSQISCSRYGPCRDLMADRWLRHIARCLEAAEQDHNNGIRKISLAMFATHTEVILSAMRKMGIAIERVATTGGFIAEIRITGNDSGKNRVRLFEFFPHGAVHTIIKANLLEASFCDENWIDVDNWTNGFKNFNLQ